MEEPKIGAIPHYVLTSNRIISLSEAIKRYSEGKMESSDTRIIKKWAKEIILQCELHESMEKESIKKAKDAVKMVDYECGPVPEELCTIDSDGGADDYMGCGCCFDQDGVQDCEECVVNKVFQHYAELTGQTAKRQQD